MSPTSPSFQRARRITSSMRRRSRPRRWWCSHRRSPAPTNSRCPNAAAAVHELRRCAGPQPPRLCYTPRSMAIRITRVYTRTGDKGTTALVGGARVPKDSPRVACYGAIDELNAVLGLARSFNAEAEASPSRDKLETILARLQNELFDLGSELATPPEAE